MSPEDFGTLANLVLAVIIIAVIGVRFLRMQKQTKDHPNYQAAKAKEESAKEPTRKLPPGPFLYMMLFPMKRKHRCLAARCARKNGFLENSVR